LILSGASCQVKLEDHEVCGDKGELGAKCFHLKSAGTRALSYEEWEEERFGQLCMKDTAFANLKKAILKLCDQTKRCTWEELQVIQKFDTRIQTFKKETAK